MGRRGRHAFLDHWHDHRVELADGRVLSWTVFANVDPPFLDCFAIDGRPVHTSIAVPLLEASGHPDAAIDVRRPSGGGGWFH